MPEIKRTILLLSTVFLTLAMIAVPVVAQGIPASVCDVVIYDETVELQDSRIAADLARSNHAAYLRIFEMIEGLWEGSTIPRMDYIEARYDRDASKLELERANLIIERQAALVEQYRLICDRTESEREKRQAAVRKTYLRYRRADCDSLAKGVEVAATNLEFNREYFKTILELRKQNHATHTQVILAELDVELEEKSHTDAQQRAASCRDEIVELEDITR